jgi:hypothetical protein
MMGRLENVFRHGRQVLRGGYAALVTASACGLLVLLLWPQSPRTYQAEASATASSQLETAAKPGEAISWLKSDEVLRAAITNLQTNQPHTLGNVLGDSLSGDPIDTLRQRLQVVPLASPDEMPRLAIGCRASRPRAALAIADELARQLAEHFGAQRRHDLRARFEEKERQVQQELSEAQSAQERLEVQLEGLRHAQLTSALAASAAQTAAAAPPPTAAPAENGPMELKRTLDSLKVERDRLLEVYLPAHPQIQSLIAQISHLEDSMRRSAPEGEDGGENPPRSEKRSGGSQPILEWHRGQDSSAATPGKQDVASSAAKLDSELTAAIQKAQLDLLAATQRRKEAEQKSQALADERTEMAAAGGLAWSIQPARIVETRGGSQGRQQLAAALIAAVGGGLGVAWLTRLAARDRPLETAAELGMSISVPVLGTLACSDEETSQAPATTQAQWGVNLATRCAEVVVLTFVLTLLAAVAMDRGLLSDLMLDPLAALSDLLRRLV